MTTEKHTFQTEASKLLKLMTHSLYSNREIFLRELVSNAADACDKLRFEALDKPDLYEGEEALKIRVELDESAKTVTITDNGIGMNRDEVVANIGTIASSGTAKFMDNLTGDQQKDAALIGQFGVGFYSSFIVADKVELFTRRAGDAAENGVHWHCDGEAEYEISTTTKAERGTRVVLHLKSDAEEFSQDWTVRSIIKRYSDHIAIPVEMLKPSHGEPEDTGEEAEDSTVIDVPEYEAVNSVEALWTRSRSDLKDEDYKEFYNYLTHDFEAPLTWSHNRVEGKLDYTSLLYLPKKPLNDLFQREAPRGLKLYINRTFILDDAEQFMPLYLRFVKGVIDSKDLPLNVSRELLQESPQVDSIRSALTKRVLDMLGKMAKKKPEDYQTFWDAFGNVFKEGPVEDAANKEKLSALLRFSSTLADSPKQDRALDDYISEMKEGQDKIYYIVAESFNMAKRSPLLEAFRSNGFEVLLLSDRIDEWLMGNMFEYDGKQFQDVSRGTLDLDDTKKTDTDTEEVKEDNPLVEALSKYLGDRVSEVRESNRLVESPACLVVNEQDMGAQMRKIMAAAGQDVPDTKPVLEINPSHPLLARVSATEGTDTFNDLAEIIFDQASLSVGEQIDDPVAYVQRINRLLLDLGV